MSRGQSPDTSFQLDEGTALQRLQNGLESGLSISKPTASAHSAEILGAINKMELTFPMLTSEGAEDRVRWLLVTCDEMRVVRVTRLAVRPLSRQQGATWQSTL